MEVDSGLPSFFFGFRPPFIQGFHLFFFPPKNYVSFDISFLSKRRRVLAAAAAAS
jgi:hypothetical protein